MRLLLLLALLAAAIAAQCVTEQLAPPQANQNYDQYISWLQTLRQTVLSTLNYSGELYVEQYGCL